MIIEGVALSDKYISEEVHCGSESIVMHDGSDMLVFERKQVIELVEVLQKWLAGEEAE